MEKVKVCTTLWVRAIGLEWHVPHKVVQTLTFLCSKTSGNKDIYGLVNKKQSRRRNNLCLERDLNLRAFNYATHRYILKVHLYMYL
jgi:hypothetical protein